MSLNAKSVHADTQHTHPNDKHTDSQAEKNSRHTLSQMVNITHSRRINKNTWTSKTQVPTAWVSTRIKGSSWIIIGDDHSFPKIHRYLLTEISLKVVIKLLSSAQRTQHTLLTWVQQCSGVQCRYRRGICSPEGQTGRSHKPGKTTNFCVSDCFQRTWEGVMTFPYIVPFHSVMYSMSSSHWPL